jgi:signal transduction histidine kinase
MHFTMPQRSRHERASDSPVSLAEVLCTGELEHRPSRPAQLDVESHALRRLMRDLADTPQTVLDTLTQTMLSALHAGSAGVSLLEQSAGVTRAVWRAVAGSWKPHTGNDAPRDFSPTGDALDNGGPVLLCQAQRRYQYLLAFAPPPEEWLIVPFGTSGTPCGAVWAVLHERGQQFDREDVRLLRSFADVAAAACAWQHAALPGPHDRVPRLAGRRKDIFMATLAHELRQPISIARTALEVMQQRRDGAYDARARQVLARQMEVLRRLVEDMLEAATVSEGKLDLQRQRFDARDVLRDVAAGMTAVFQARRQRFSLHLPGENLDLFADRTRLQQIVVNLLTNAAKYTPEAGDIALHLERHGAAAAIRVTDNGKGISPDALPYVFDLFMQEDGHHPAGLGIGLNVVRGLVEAHGGTVVARSDGIGRGSEFIVTLPVAEAAQAM